MGEAAEKTLQILEKVTGAPEVRKDLDLDLFTEPLLDSLSLVELIVALSDELKVSISPAEVERDAWSTPRKIIAFIEQRKVAGKAA